MKVELLRSRGRDSRRVGDGAYPPAWGMSGQPLIAGVTLCRSLSVTTTGCCASWPTYQYKTGCAWTVNPVCSLGAKTVSSRVVSAGSRVPPPIRPPGAPCGGGEQARDISPCPASILHPHPRLPQSRGGKYLMQLSHGGMLDASSAWEHASQTGVASGEAPACNTGYASGARGAKAGSSPSPSG
jgi:hypothetical protein